MLEFLQLNKNKYPQNYSIEEVSEKLENPNPIIFIKRNWNILNAQQIADHLGIGKRKVFKLVQGQIGKKKHIVTKRPTQKGILILDTHTGIYYENIPEVAKAYNVNPATMGGYMTGRTKKYTHLKRI